MSYRMPMLYVAYSRRVLVAQRSLETIMPPQALMFITISLATIPQALTCIPKEDVTISRPPTTRLCRRRLAQFLWRRCFIDLRLRRSLISVLAEGLGMQIINGHSSYLMMTHFIPTFQLRRFPIMEVFPILHLR